MTGILLIIGCSLCITISHTFFKLGAPQFRLTKPWLLFSNRFVLLGIFTTIGTFIFNVTAYRFGDISALSPLLKLTMLWTMLVAVFFFKEKVNAKAIFGICLILSGVIFLLINPS